MYHIANENGDFLTHFDGRFQSKADAWFQSSYNRRKPKAYKTRRNAEKVAQIVDGTVVEV